MEYQLIKYKKDWGRWNRRIMARKACWRYWTFAEKAQTSRGRPGLEALARVRNVNKRCGRNGGDIRHRGSAPWPQVARRLPRSELGHAQHQKQLWLSRVGMRTRSFCVEIGSRVRCAHRSVFRDTLLFLSGS